LKLTLPSRAECTSRDLVAELATLLAAKLLTLFGGKQTLVLIHVLLVLLGTDDVRQDVGVGILRCESSVLAVGADLRNDALNGRLCALIAERA
jgi:hypothetical protein